MVLAVPAADLVVRAQGRAVRETGAIAMVLQAVVVVIPEAREAAVRNVRNDPISMEAW